MTQYNWDDVERMYKWMVTNANGTVWAFAERPTLNYQEGRWQADDGIACYFGTVPSVYPLATGWRNSIEKRPEPKQRWELINNTDGGRTLMDHKSGKAAFATYDPAEGLEEIVKVLNEYEETTHD
jgi:hypothetical protein